VTFAAAVHKFHVEGAAVNAGDPEVDGRSELRRTCTRNCRELLPERPAKAPVQTQRATTVKSSHDAVSAGLRPAVGSPFVEADRVPWGRICRFCWAGGTNQFARAAPPQTAGKQTRVQIRPPAAKIATKEFRRALKRGLSNLRSSAVLARGQGHWSANHWPLAMETMAKQPLSEETCTHKHRANHIKTNQQTRRQQHVNKRAETSE
jgi:hypothetical protein